MATEKVVLLVHGELLPGVWRCKRNKSGFFRFLPFPLDCSTRRHMRVNRFNRTSPREKYIYSVMDGERSTKHFFLTQHILSQFAGHRPEQVGKTSRHLIVLVN